MGVSLQSLSKLLNSQPNMTLKTVTKFELALGIKIIPQVITGYSNEEPFFFSPMRFPWRMVTLRAI